MFTFRKPQAKNGHSKLNGQRGMQKSQQQQKKSENCASLFRKKGIISE
jgi:hypothetical protein